ncbi:Fungal specific transcription factor [Lambiella insularis]|nr:Fungal specific transcription factor [Lambiella insularis]
MPAAAVADGVTSLVQSPAMMAPAEQEDSTTTPKQKSINAGKGVSSRGRRERPCDACRKRKGKCVITDGQKSCAACAVHGQECTYIEDPQPRKRRLDNDAKDADGTKRRSTIAGLDGPITDFSMRTGSETNLMYATNDAPMHPKQEASQRPSQHHSTHIGPTTELEPMLLDLSSVNGNALPGDLYQKSDNRTAFLIDQNGFEGFKAANLTALGALERLVGSYGPLLMQLYLNFIHRNFPIIEEEFLLEYNNGRISNLDPALLASIYLLTMPWLEREMSRAASQLPDVYHLEDMAFRLFSDSLYKPTLSTIQAGILLLQRPNTDSKTLNSQLVGAAYEIGLHLDCSSWKSSAAEKKLRKRLAWALYLQDKWCSLIHGRPSVIYRSNWAVKVLTNDDFDSLQAVNEDAVRGQALFKEMVSLTEILSTILDTFYTLRAMQEVDDAVQGGTRLILERAKPVQIKLKEWFAGLPANLKIDDTMTGKPSSTGYLHLAYFATEITLHRCIIRSLESSNGDPYLAHICRSAAKTRLISAMDFVNRLRSEHLNAFWYFPSKVNFALIGTFGCLLLATAPCQEEVEFYRTRLAEYRWTLSVSSKTVSFLSFAVESLDSSSGLLHNLPRRPSTAQMTAQLAAMRPLQSMSPTKDGFMSEAGRLHLGSLPASDAGNPSASVSGLASPSTSTSSGSTTYEAYVEMFPTYRSR